MAVRKKVIPDTEQGQKEIPEATALDKPKPTGEIKKKEKPSAGNPENTVKIGGQ
jgi:hypothetical protein